MRILIAEDDYASGMYLTKLLSRYGKCDLAIDGIETADAFLMAIEEEKKYDLVCLDIMMPKVNGIRLLSIIRSMEKENGINKYNRVKIIMISALSDKETVDNCTREGCELFLSKPISIKDLDDAMSKLGFRV